MLFLRKRLEPSKLKALFHFSKEIQKASGLSLRGISSNSFCLFNQSKEEDLLKICSILKTPKLKTNSEIGKNIMVRVLDEEKGGYLGTMTIDQAVSMVRSMDLDLVLHNPKVEPVLCKAMDYRKHLYSRFVDEILKKDILVNKKYDKKLQISIEQERLKANITKHDLEIKIAKMQRKISKVKKLVVKMRVKGSELENGMAIFANYQNLSKNFLAPLERLSFKNASHEDFEENSALNFNETQKEQFQKMDNQFDDFQVTKQDHLDKRNINRDAQYIITQSFEPLKEFQEKEKNLDPNFSDKELEDLVRTYFNMSRRGLHDQKQKMEGISKVVEKGHKSDREQALEDSIAKQKMIKMGKRSLNPNLQLLEEIKHKSKKKLAAEELRKNLIGLDQIEEEKELDRNNIFYEHLRSQYRKNKGNDPNEEEFRQFLEDSCTNNLAILKKLMF